MTQNTVRVLTTVREDRARGLNLRLRFFKCRAQEANPRLLHRRVVRSELQRLGAIPGKVQLESLVACRNAIKVMIVLPSPSSAQTGCFQCDMVGSPISSAEWICSAVCQGYKRDT